tara:strand:- start:30 stop:1919 length:1890 start_codon:yes stop_codon:yes gene_type:complete
MDGNKSYFLLSDIEYFNNLSNQIDDMIGSQSLQPVFDMYEVYRTRAKERMTYALQQLELKKDFTIDENFLFDRSNSTWANSINELNEIWRKRVKNDALNLKLTGKEWSEIQELLNKRYSRFLKQMDQLNNDDVFESFMNAFTHSLDPHSSYMSPRNSEEYQIQMSLSYYGIGATLQIEDDYVLIVNLIPGGPAAIDGKLKPKDKITAVGQGVDGKLIDVIGWRIGDVVELIRGPENTVVKLQILSSGAIPGASEKIINITRNQVKLEDQAAKSNIISVPRENTEWNIGVITIPSFYRDFKSMMDGNRDYASTTKDVKRIIKELKEKNIDALILDLRSNGGGHLTEATALSGLFIENGPIVQLRNANGRISRLDDPDPSRRLAYNGPLIVLVNRFSASASEIFAAAIQDYGRGIIVGQQTFGKGTVQNLYPLNRYIKKPKDKEFGQLTMTIGKYYRVTGESTQHRGVMPDIELPSHIDLQLVGESTRKTALPWDTIRTAKFKLYNPALENAIPSLSKKSISRSKTNDDLRFLIEEIEKLKNFRAKKTISLNLEQREQERNTEIQDQLKRGNERISALNLELGIEAPDFIKSLEELEQLDLPEVDINLNEAAEIAADLILLNNDTLITKNN